MTEDRLSQTLTALADPTRRAILARLALGEDLGHRTGRAVRMSLPAVSKHLKVLEKAGLISRGREAQWRPCKLEPEPLKEVDAGSASTARCGRPRFDRLDAYLKTLKPDGEVH
ncbi:MAG: metalloregulator ArsR/SmtB family transcription factor [Asticcacaulis sp.]